MGEVTPTDALRSIKYPGCEDDLDVDICFFVLLLILSFPYLGRDFLLCFQRQEKNGNYTVPLF